jgi:hypothetical protein
MRRIAINVLVAAGAFLVAALLAELAVRLLYKKETVLFPRYHSAYHYGPYVLRGIRPRAEFWHTSADGSWRFVTNARGLRDSRDFPYAKPAGTLRVLALGDSQTQGYEVSQEATFSAVLERYLDARGAHAEVLNAGVSGFSTAEELAYLENEGHRYAPEVVVLGWYGNDFVDNLTAGLFTLDAAGRLVERRKAHVPGVRVQELVYGMAPMRWLSENSYFYSALFNKTWLYFKLQLRQQARLEHAVADQPARSRYEVALAIALIERMHAFCQARGMRLIVVDVPRPLAPRRVDSSLPPTMLAQLRAIGVEVLDSREVLREADGTIDLHLPNGQRHISALTHFLIGAALGRRILGERESLLWVRHDSPAERSPVGARGIDGAVHHAR